VGPGAGGVDAREAPVVPLESGVPPTARVVASRCGNPAKLWNGRPGPSFFFDAPDMRRSPESRPEQSDEIDEGGTLAPVFNSFA
jgi:hypothetical protein